MNILLTCFWLALPKDQMRTKPWLHIQKTIMSSILTKLQGNPLYGHQVPAKAGAVYWNPARKLVRFPGSFTSTWAVRSSIVPFPGRDKPLALHSSQMVDILTHPSRWMWSSTLERGVAVFVLTGPLNFGSGKFGMAEVDKFLRFLKLEVNLMLSICWTVSSWSCSESWQVEITSKTPRTTWTYLTKLYFDNLFQFQNVNILMFFIILGQTLAYNIF